MRKNLKWLIVFGVIAVLTLAIAIPAFAAGPSETNGNQANGQGIGTSISESVTDLLGLSNEQIQEQRQAGNSLVEIAAGQGIGEDVLIEAILKDRQVTLQNMVEAGTITQLQADQRIAQMTERVNLAVNRTTTGAPEWAGSGTGAGMGAQNGSGRSMSGKGGLGGNQSGCTGTPGTCTGAGKMNRSGNSSK
jgi:hypothetical protein